MNPSIPTIGWIPDVKEKKFIGLNQYLQSNYRGSYYVHDNECLVREEKQMKMGLVRSHRSSFELMQNCDLPPPVKIFSSADTTPHTFTKFGGVCEEQEEKLGLLKALQLSQTRAREAEKQAAILTKERDSLTDSLLNQSLKLFAHRQWVKLLEIEISQLKSQNQKQKEEEEK